ncbi:MAG: hypothetical protein J7521_00885 [Caulobacter sp.]|nr:hypothetical protein [Caulobacter sp.]
MSSSEPSVPPPLQADKTLPVLVYALYLAGLANGLTAVIGLVVAYASRKQAPDWMASHYVFQIRTFWLWVLFSIAGLALLPVGVGFLVLTATWIWMAARCILGLSWLLKGQAYPTPRNWII